MLRIPSISVFLSLVYSVVLQAQIIETDSTGYTRIFYGNGQVSSEGYMHDGKPDGYWRTYYVDGTVKSEGNRNNFRLDSIWVFYDPDGDTSSVISYNFGKKNGYYITYNYWYEKQGKDSIKKGVPVSKELYLNDKKEGLSLYYGKTNRLEKSIYYLNNKRHGQGKEFAEDGRIITMLEYHNDYEINKQRINRYDNEGKKHGRWMDFYPGDRIKLEEPYNHGVLDGYLREYDKKGNIIRIGLFRNGILVQENPEVEEDSMKIEVRNEYYPSGNIRYSGRYREGVPVGIHREYNQREEITGGKLYSEDGALLGSGIVDEESRKQGKWIYYHETGEVMAEGKYRDDRRTGKWEFLFENGKTEQKGKYKDGKPHGDWTWYYQNGQVRREENFEKGVEEGKYKEYYENGEVLAEGEYLDGEQNGEWYYKVGDQIEKGKYFDGLKDGLWQSYYPNGKKSFEGYYIQGSENGKHKFFYESGEPRLEVNYIMGRKEGKWIQFDELGIMNKYIIFKDDMEYRINGSRFKLPDDKDE